jgi:hypothetical protein
MAFQLLAISFLFAQTIRRCNNNPGVTGANVYTTIQAAHDAAAAGDIIYVEPSTAAYGSLTVIKRVTIIGNGYYNDKNSNTAFDSRTSKVSSISFNNGSASSILMGIEFTSGGSNLGINDINITVTRCKNIGFINFASSTNLALGTSSRGNNATITKNLISGKITGSNSTNVTLQYGYNCIISNNIFLGQGIGSFCQDLTNCVLSNNVFNGSNLQDLYGCSISNNIFDARNSTISFSYVSGISVGNTISNNICLGQAATPSGNGNIDFGSPLNTFMVADPWANVSTQDAQFQLKAGSPAIGIGTGGTNAGAFGGASPYVLSGLPPYPIITNFTASGVGNTSTPLQVSVTVRGNN